MKRCDHSRGNIQQFTEVCLDCGHNIYESDEDYLSSLESEIRALKADLQKRKIEVLEKEYDELLQLKNEAEKNG